MIKLFKSKKAAGEPFIFLAWPEVLAFCFLIIGFMLAAIAKSAVISYIIIFFCGMIAGRIWFIYKKEMKVTIALMLAGFLIGFLIGNFYGSTLATIMSFLFGLVLSYNFHHKYKFLSL
ncbi:MAG: hypothetical protein Q8O89_08520 [Nanoarchaeota archaeon]|nr:hypothetical protein [Nanoarchaeota archaeon]